MNEQSYELASRTLAIKKGEVELAHLEQQNKFQMQLEMAKQIADSGLLGIENPSQAMVLGMMAESEGRSYISAFSRYDIIEGKPAMKAQTMQADFTAAGGVIYWHIRHDAIVGASFFSKQHADKANDEKVLEKLNQRFKLIVDEQRLEKDQREERLDLITKIAELSVVGVETVVRTLKDAKEKGIALTSKGDLKHNWSTSPRQMLTARVISEGVRLCAPALLNGMYDPEEAQDSQIQLQAHQDAPESKEAGDKLQFLKSLLVEKQRLVKSASGPSRQKLLGEIAEIKLDIEETVTAPAEIDDDVIDIAPEPEDDEILITATRAKSFYGRRICDLNREGLLALRDWFANNADKKESEIGFLEQQKAVQDALNNNS